MLILLFIYLTVFIGIGMLAALYVKKTEDFYVAGRHGSIALISLSLLSTILGSSAILGTISLSQHTGWAASWMMLSGSLGLLCLIPLAKFVRRCGQYTLPELLESFYGKASKQLACAMIPIAWTGVVAAQIIGSGKIISFMTPLSYTVSACLASTLFILYTLLGGQASIIKTDRWQGTLIFVGLMTAVLAAQKTCPFPSWETIRGTFPLNPAFSVTDLLVLFLTYASTFVVGPDIYSRLLCAKDERTATASVAVTAVLLAPIGFILAFIGMTGHAHSFNFLKTGLTPYIITLGLLSAVISSADTTLLTAAATCGQLFTNLHHRSSIRTTRILIATFGLLSLMIALVLPNIIQTLLLAFSFFSGAFFIPTIAGLLGYRTSTRQVIYACLLGGILSLAGKLCLIFHCGSGENLIIGAFVLNAIILFWGRAKQAGQNKSFKL